jgi:hypothetical protein
MLSRRNLLHSAASGLGGVALWQLLGLEGALGEVALDEPRTDLNGGLHHPAKAKRVIQLFMNGMDKSLHRRPKNVSKQPQAYRAMCSVRRSSFHSMESADAG